VLDCEAFSLCPPLRALSTRAGKAAFWPRKHPPAADKKQAYLSFLYRLHEYRGLEI